MIGRELVELDAISQTAERIIDRTDAPVLRATGIGRKGVLQPADLDVYNGEVVGIAGLLGSGRTELVRLIYGADHADAGAIEVNGEPAKLASPRHSIGHRIAFSSEDRREPRASSPTSPLRRTSCWASRRVVAGCAGSVAPSRRPSSRSTITALGVRPADPNRARRQPVRGQPAEGAARALARDRTRSSSFWTSRPAASMSEPRPTSSARSPSCRDEGLSVIFISSELEEVLRLAQRVVVMRDRRQVGWLDSSEVDIDGLIDYMANAGEGSVA